ncbi:hypothetical protein DY000_02021339 [Brassica cretica]|uniref:Uncharacterized protein n=1 Tax=Brassica cretica TaxID=69181 RepID=A0ABQ7EGC3_BRACR|nr:hypothetical protein DY000_02021339 [Brassica cretica]
MIATVLMFEKAAVITARRIARASAINADDTRLRVAEIRGRRVRVGEPEKRPPSPHIPERASHAAST